MSAKPKTKAKPKAKAKGKRYTPQQKARVLDFVAKTNAAKGRGGITAASKKFKVTPLTISNWIKSAKAPKTTGAKKSTGTPRTSGSFSVKLRRLADLHDSIAKLQSEYDALKASL